MADVGRMMKISHDGDRVVAWTQDGQSKLYHAPTGNNYLLGLMADLESGDPDRVDRAQLTWQPGSYSCSLPAIDRIRGGGARWLPHSSGFFYARLAPDWDILRLAFLSPANLALVPMQDVLGLK